VGGFTFHLTQGWQASAGGGIDIALYQNSTQTHENVNSEIRYVSQSISFSVTYQRQFTSAIGIPRLLMSDVFGATLGHRIGGAVSARVQSYYYRSSDQSSNGWLRTFSGSCGLDIPILRQLIAGISAVYQNQQSQNFSVQGLQLSRFTVSAGIQYLWPSIKRTGD
jgi:hypothetical protein